MDKDILIPLVEKIRGCTFATLNALTEPKRGVMCHTECERVIIFRTYGKSGWEGMIKRRLKEAGKNPDSFNVTPLPWGTRLGNLPIIECNSEFYLQTITLVEGKKRYYLFGAPEIDIEPLLFGIKPHRGYEGLPSDDTVKMRTYNIKNIEKITLLGSTVGTQVQSEPRAILSLKFGDK